MQIYHVETQEDYDALMVELEERGYLWLSDKKPTSKGNRWLRHKEDFCVVINNKMMTYADIRWCKKQYPNATFRKYKAKQNYKAEEYASMPKKKTLSQAINDVVNSPNHYTQNGRETIENIRDTMSSEGYQGYCVGNVVKYLARYKFKNGLEDVKKAKKYIEFLEEELMKQED